MTGVVAPDGLDAMNVLSMSRFSLTYADPPSVIVTTPTCPLAITTDALAPLQLVVPASNNFIP